jgi:hypothetical protein
MRRPVSSMGHGANRVQSLGTKICDFAMPVRGGKTRHVNHDPLASIIWYATVPGLISYSFRSPLVEYLHSLTTRLLHLTSTYQTSTNHANISFQHIHNQLSSSRLIRNSNSHNSPVSKVTHKSPTELLVGSPRPSA